MVGVVVHQMENTMNTQGSDEQNNETPSGVVSGEVTMVGEAISTPAGDPVPEQNDAARKIAKIAMVVGLIALFVLAVTVNHKFLLMFGVGMALVGNTLERNNDRDRFVAAFPATAFLRFYNGSAPAATAAATGTLIAEITLPTSPWDTGTNGSAIKQNTWSTTTTLAGTPTYFRFVNAAGTTVRQGVVGVDITAAAVATNGDTYTVTSLTLTFA